MTSFVSNLHFLNMFLVLATGTVTAIWGFILYFISRPKRIPRGEAANTAQAVETTQEGSATNSPATAMKGPWRISLIVTAVVAILQALLGIILVLLGQKPGTGTGLYYLHYVYGGIVALALIVGFTYTTSGKNPRRDILVLSIAALILVAAAARALTTGLQ